jgi:RND family efflux transporter MFP subunit
MNTKPGKSRKTLIVVLASIVIAVIAAGAIFLTKTPGNSEAATPAVQTAAASDGTILIAVEAVSVAEPALSTVLRNRTAGYVRFVQPEGTLVQAGEAVVSFDDAELRKAMNQAELALRQAQVNRDRAIAAEKKAGSDLETRKNLFASKAATQEQVDSALDALSTSEFNRKAADLSVEQVNLSLAQAERDLKEATLRASFIGVVSNPAVAPGDFAPANTQLAAVVDLSRILFRAEVDEYDIGKLTDGLPVTVTVPALQDSKFRAKVQGISPTAEVVNNISIFRVSVLVDNAEGRLRPGMSADVNIVVSNEKGIIVPSKAVTTVRGRSYVDVLPESGEVETRKVSIGSTDGRNIIITEGLEAGEKVVLPGAPAPAAAAAPASGGTSIIPISVPGTGGR